MIGVEDVSVAALGSGTFADEGITPGLGFQVATPDAIKAKRAELGLGR